eukprot:scaffold6353_cov58-Cylindrotheca_fusiformis.AAC.1
MTTTTRPRGMTKIGKILTRLLRALLSLGITMQRSNLRIKRLGIRVSFGVYTSNPMEVSRMMLTMTMVTLKKVCFQSMFVAFPRRKKRKKSNKEVLSNCATYMGITILNEIPFVFEASTTLDGLHEVIAKCAATGKDASTIIERMYKANSVRLDHRNKEKMQNFYDVLLRRFIGVGDAIFDSGDGGEELGRFASWTVF